MNKLLPLLSWLDSRTGIIKLLHEALYEPIPGGARWRYVWGSTLVFAFATQAITGLCLWAAYSPSSQTAWESVYYIHHEMTFGWFLRGLHHFMAQAMVVLLAVHVIQVVLAGAYRAPREVNWWLGMLLLLVVLGLSLTGYLLPWDQKGYWATQVATKIMAVAPGGDLLQPLVIGGPDYGHHTLTRFFALHAGLLPALLIGLLVAHLAVFRRHGVTYPPGSVGETTFFPAQMFLDVVACAGVLAVVVILVLYNGGADLGAPADPARSYDAARPEWYFLFLFQFLKYFEGDAEVIGAVYIPTLVILMLLAFPLIGILRIGHAFNRLATVGLMGGVLFLTLQALRKDAGDPDHQRAVADAKADGERAAELAKALRIPKGGAVELVRQDPKTQGPLLFSENCKACHRWDGHDGRGNVPPEAATASDLVMFGRSPDQWLAAFLKAPDDPKHLGNTTFKDGAMVQWAKAHAAHATAEEISALAAALRASTAEIEKLSQLGDDEDGPAPSPAEQAIRKGLDVFEFGFEACKDEVDAMGCQSCHSLGSVATSGIEPGPDLTGYLDSDGSWLRRMIEDPTHENLYGKRNDRMPTFGRQIRADQIDLLVKWMRGQWVEASPSASR